MWFIYGCDVAFYMAASFNVTWAVEKKLVIIPCITFIPKQSLPAKSTLVLHMDELFQEWAVGNLGLHLWFDTKIIDLFSLLLAVDLKILLEYICLVTRIYSVNFVWSKIREYE